MVRVGVRSLLLQTFDPKWSNSILHRYQVPYTNQTDIHYGPWHTNSGWPGFITWPLDINISLGHGYSSVWKAIRPIMEVTLWRRTRISLSSFEWLWCHREACGDESIQQLHHIQHSLHAGLIDWFLSQLSTAWILWLLDWTFVSYNGSWHWTINRPASAELRDEGRTLSN